jgi:ribosomal-protein-alanine N-acetyltransferase
MQLPFRSSAMRGPRLKQGRVYLRPARHSDWRAWASLRAESRSFLIPWEPSWNSDALGRAAFRRRLRSHEAEWQRGAGYSFLLFRSDDDTLLGGVTLSNVRRGVAQSASLGYWIGEGFARQGFMTDGLTAVLDFAFERLALHRIEAACLPDNDASQSLLRKIGFKEEGYSRQYLRINGRWQDHRLFAVLQDDPRLRP